MGCGIEFTDEGSLELTDINLAMKDGYSSGKSLGLGLPGAKKTGYDFNYRVHWARGTSVTILKWANG
jgi:serine/threonine-protein kinase RsbT